MITFVYSPQWFYGIDIVIDLVSMLVLFLIAFFGIRYFLLDRNNKNYLFLATSFLMLSAAFFFKILTNFTIYYNVLETRHFGLFSLTYQTLESSDLLFTIGSYLFRLSTFFGLLLILNITKKQPLSSNIIISVLFLVLSYYAQNLFHLFHAICFFLLFFITLNYIQKYKETKHKTTLMISYSFAMITLSSLIFYFMIYGKIFYAIAEIIQLSGYILFLITFITILRCGKDCDYSKKEFSNGNYEKNGNEKHGKKKDKT